MPNCTVFRQAKSEITMDKEFAGKRMQEQAVDKQDETYHGPDRLHNRLQGLI